MKPLTGEQKHLAELNHDLVYKFLNENNLPESEYYDVVIFGYLCAAQEYCENSKLKRYSFSTVAWKKMCGAVKDHKKYLSREKRDCPTVSLSDLLGNTEDSLQVEDILSLESKLLEELKLNLMLHTLAANVTKKQMRIIRMKLEGYRMHDIAKAEKMTFQDINKMLKSTYPAWIDIL